MDPDMHSGSPQQYVVQPGDTMWLIAQRYGVSLSDLIAANPQIKNPDLIYPGQVIYIPAPPMPPPSPGEWHCAVLAASRSTAPEPGSALYRCGTNGHLMVAAMGMPAPSVFGPYQVYAAWVTGPAGMIVRHFDLLPAVDPQFWINHLDIAGLLMGSRVTVTPEPREHGSRPSGPIVLAGRLV